MGVVLGVLQCLQMKPLLGMWPSELGSVRTHSASRQMTAGRLSSGGGCKILETAFQARPMTEGGSTRCSHTHIADLVCRGNLFLL